MKIVLQSAFGNTHSPNDFDGHPTPKNRPNRPYEAIHPAAPPSATAPKSASLAASAAASAHPPPPKHPAAHVSRSPDSLQKSTDETHRIKLTKLKTARLQTLVIPQLPLKINNLTPHRILLRLEQQRTHSHPHRHSRAGGRFGGRDVHPEPWDKRAGHLRKSPQSAVQTTPAIPDTYNDRDKKWRGITPHLPNPPTPTVIPAKIHPPGGRFSGRNVHPEPGTNVGGASG